MKLVMLLSDDPSVGETLKRALVAHVGRACTGMLNKLEIQVEEVPRRSALRVVKRHRDALVIQPCGYKKHNVARSFITPTAYFPRLFVLHAVSLEEHSQNGAAFR
jgi:hypothetical protein